MGLSGYDAGMKSIRDQVYNIIASALDVKWSDIRPTSSWDDYEADSLAVVELVFALEEHFGVSFEMVELERMKTVADAVRAIEQKRGAA